VAPGRQAPNPARIDPYTIDPKFGYRCSTEAHSLKFGYEHIDPQLAQTKAYPLYEADTYLGRFSAAGGADQSTALPTTEANAAYCLADFLKEARTLYELSATQVFNYKQRFLFFYGPDDWKAS